MKPSLLMSPTSVRRSVAVAAALLVPRAVSACPVCFGADDGPILQGSNMGILTLLVVTVAVLAAFGGFFLALARRAARHRRDLEDTAGLERSGLAR